MPGTAFATWETWRWRRLVPKLWRMAEPSGIAPRHDSRSRRRTTQRNQGSSSFGVSLQTSSAHRLPPAEPAAGPRYVVTSSERPAAVPAAEGRQITTTAASGQADRAMSSGGTAVELLDGISGRRNRESSLRERLANEPIGVEVHLPVILVVAVRPDAQQGPGRRELQHVDIRRRRRQDVRDRRQPLLDQPDRVTVVDRVADRRRQIDAPVRVRGEVLDRVREDLVVADERLHVVRRC